MRANFFLVDLVFAKAPPAPTFSLVQTFVWETAEASGFGFNKNKPDIDKPSVAGIEDVALAPECHEGANTQKFNKRDCSVVFDVPRVIPLKYSSEYSSRALIAKSAQRAFIPRKTDPGNRLYFQQTSCERGGFIVLAFVGIDATGRGGCHSNCAEATRRLEPRLARVNNRNL